MLIINNRLTRILGSNNPLILSAMKLTIITMRANTKINALANTPIL